MNHGRQVEYSPLRTPTFTQIPSPRSGHLGLPRDGCEQTSASTHFPHIRAHRHLDLASRARAGLRLLGFCVHPGRTALFPLIRSPPLPWRYLGCIAFAGFQPWGRHLVTTATLCACGVLILLKFLLLFVVIIVGSLLLAGQAVKQLRGVPAFLQDTFRGRGALRKNPNLRRDTSKRCEETFDTLEKLKTRDAEIDYLKRAVSVNNEKTDRDSFKAKAKRGGKYLRELL